MDTIKIVNTKYIWTLSCFFLLTSIDLHGVRISAFQNPTYYHEVAQDFFFKNLIKENTNIKQAVVKLIELRRDFLESIHEDKNQFLPLSSYVNIVKDPQILELQNEVKKYAFSIELMIDKFYQDYHDKKEYVNAAELEYILQNKDKINFKEQYKNLQIIAEEEMIYGGLLVWLQV